MPTVTPCHVKKADDAYHLGRAPLANYLNPVKIADVAVALGCDAIHPGYGFLSENPVLARLCSLRRIHFIGPPATIIRHMGDKVKARKKMREAGVPVIPGSKRRLPSIAQALRLANTIGYPVMLKATNGGGGAVFAAAKTPTKLGGFSRVSLRKPKKLSARPIYLWKNVSSTPVILRCRSSPTNTATWCICLSVIAPSKGAIKN